MMSPAVGKPLSSAAHGETRPDHAAGERRRSHRAPLHWTVYLSGNDGRSPVRAVTRDISCDGFYCFVNQRYGPGDPIECDIVAPTHHSRDPDDVFYLRCRARAVRIEADGAGTGYGLACCIESYRLVRVAASPGINSFET